MARPAPLTTQFCFSPSALQDFLRLSRATVDDTISQNLDAALSAGPATGLPFDPPSLSSSSSSSSSQFMRPRHQQLRPVADPRACAAFRDRALFPAWHARSAALAHCGRVAAASDPDDPDAAARLAEAERAAGQLVNKRLDPYSGRFFARESRSERLARVVEQENIVEDIIRRRSWDAVRARCHGGGGGGDEAGEGELEQDWRGGMEAWRRRNRVAAAGESDAGGTGTRP